MQEVHDAVKDVVEAQLAPANIVELFVDEDEDADGDPIFLIVVVVEAEGTQPDPEQILGLTRHLNKRLNDLQKEHFPIFSFMTSEEAANAAG